MTANSVGNRFIRGAVWMLLSKLLERGLGLISTLILARLLLPADFGLVAMASIIIGLVELFGSLGFEYALIQKRDLQDKHFDTVWTLNILVSLAMALLLWMAAPFAAEFFREPRLQIVINWLALGTIIQGFQNVGMVKFKKEISMGPEVAVLLGKKLSSLIIATAAALILGNYWALVWGMVLSRIVGVMMTWYLSTYIPRFTLVAWRDVTGFSTWMLVNSLLGFMLLRINDFVIGRQLGSTSLANFTVAFDLAATATGEAVSAISRAAFPAFAKLNDDNQRLRMGFRHVLSGLAIFALPAGFGIGALAERIVLTLLGPNWKPAGEIMGGLAISLAVFGVLSQISNVYFSLGKPRIPTLLSAVFVALLAALSILLVPVLGLSAVVPIYASLAVAACLGHFFCLRLVLPEFTVGDWVVAFARPLLSALIMFTFIDYLNNRIGYVPSLIQFPALMALIALGIGSYTIVLLLLWHFAGRPDGPEARMVEKLQSLLANRLRKSVP